MIDKKSYIFLTKKGKLFYDPGSIENKPLYIFHARRRHFTYLWMTRKEKWIYGPELPLEFPFSNFCSSTLDSTSAIFIGGYFQQGHHQVKMDNRFR